MPRHDRVTIKEIAKITGVSVQTVSRVINNRPDVSPETRAAVETAIAESGFQPSAVARSLVRRQSQLLGVVAAGLKYFGVAQTLNGVAQEAERAGYSIILKELASFQVPSIVPVVDMLLAQHVEGIIFAPPEMGTNIRHVREQLRRSSPPIVFLKADPTPGYTTVGIDNIAAARVATEHLLALGRTRVAHIAGPAEWREAGARREGWGSALSDAGLSRGPLAVGDWSAASGAEAMDELLDTDDSINALFAANDEMALGALHALAAIGLRGVDVPLRIGGNAMHAVEFAGLAAACLALALLAGLPGRGTALLPPGLPVVLNAAHPVWEAQVPQTVGSVVVESSLSNGAGLAPGTPVAVVRLREFSGRDLDWTLRAGRETGEWAVRRPDVARLGTLAPTPWISWVAGDFFAQHYRSRWTLPRPERTILLRVERASGAPPDLVVAVHQVEIRK